MQGGFLIRHSRLTVLGILLCVLAALFAFEAKIAWFSPAGTASAQISYNKARPAEPPKALPHRPDAPAFPSHDLAGTGTLLQPMLLLSLAAVVMIRPARAPRRVTASPGFSGPLLFRPPPVL